MAQEEPSVEELKRLLRRLEKLEPLDVPRADGLASLRTPLPPSEHLAIPSPRPPSESIAAPIPTPLVLAPDVTKPPTLRAEPAVALVAVASDERRAESPAVARPEARSGVRGLLLGLAALAVAGGVGAYLVLLPPTARQMGEPRMASPSSQTTATPAAAEAPAAAVAAAPSTPSTPNSTAEPAAPAAPPAPTGAASGAALEPSPIPSMPTGSSNADTAQPPVAVVEAPALPFAAVGALTTTAPTIPLEVVAAREATPAAAPIVSPPTLPPAPESTGPRLVTASDWGIDAGRRSAIPLVIDPPSAVANHYVLIEGLEPDAFVSRGIEVLGGTWMIRGIDIEAAEIERAASAPERATLNLELRHVDGSIVGRQSVSLTTTPHAQSPSSIKPPGANEPPRAPSETNSGSDAQRLLRRGQLMLDSGNLSGARLLWERAAQQGSSDAALALGRSYDPAQVPLPGVAGSVADRALARRWYERAAALGSSEARERAKGLD